KDTLEIINEPNQENKAHVLINLKTNQILSSHNMDEAFPVFSVTKIMFLYSVSKKIVIDGRNLDEVVTIPQETDLIANESAFSNANIQGLQEYTLRELYYAVLLPSGNDASYALAVSVFGSHDDAISAMNVDASELGMNHASFVSTSGLDGEDLSAVGIKANPGRNMMSVNDSIKLAQAIRLQYPFIIEVASTKEYEIGRSNEEMILLKNINRILDGLSSGIEGVYGLKSGSNPIENIYNMMAFKNNAHEDILLVVSFGNESREGLYVDIEELYDHEKTYQLKNLNDNVNFGLKVGGIKNDASYQLDQDYYIYTTKDMAPKLSLSNLTPNYNDKMGLVYNVNKDDVIGDVSIDDRYAFFEEHPLIKPKLIIKNDIEKKNIIAQTYEFIKRIYQK
ncbi:MAG: D-alanyl-D-alanine carboxypeptidase family protein, partial [Bacilli bacterium]